MKGKTHQEFILELQSRNPRVVAIGTYKNSSTKIEAKCVKCGYVWLVLPTSLLRGHGCPACANNQQKTNDAFVHEMLKVNPHIEVIGKYKTAHTPITVKCTICGYEWLSKPNRLLNGAQCMQCIRPHTSFMEQYMLLALRQALGNDAVKSRSTDVIGLELDIYIPSANLAIELGSWLYHEKKVNNLDYIKRQRCSSRGIRLITVYDTYPEDAGVPFENDCYVFSGFLNEPGYVRIKNLASMILNELGYDGSTVDWVKLSSDAYEANHYNANESFLKELSEIDPDIEPLERFRGSHVPILVHSKKCEHSAWMARPYTLLNGIGCPVCGREKAANSRTRSSVEFAKKLYSINPSISIVSEYVKINERVSVRCNTCGLEWSPLAYSLLAGKGCPHCNAIQGAKRRKGRNAVKSIERFVEEVSSINPKIEILGEYINNKTKVLARCLACNNKWYVVPASLLNGHGCPICSRKSKERTL